MPRKDSKASADAQFRARVLELVAQIPRGKVVTYGQVATMVDSPRSARAVGGVLSGLKSGPPTELPWHRVINSRGGVSAPNEPHRFQVQRALLEAEGVVFRENGTCDLKVFRWVAQGWSWE